MNKDWGFPINNSARTSLKHSQHRLYPIFKTSPYRYRRTGHVQTVSAQRAQLALLSERDNSDLNNALFTPPPIELFPFWKQLLPG